MNLDEYENYHEAMMMLWDALDEVDLDDTRLRGRIRRAINYLRNCAMESLPWSGDVLANKDSSGRRHGRFV